MTQKEFDNVVEDRLKLVKSSLIAKNKEYSRDNKPLHNFDKASRISGQSREKALWGFALKHYVSFMDILDDMDKDSMPSKEHIEEKIGDLINYLIICEASIKDKIK